MGQARTYKDSSGASHFSTPGAWREDFGFQRDHKVFGETKGKSVVANRVWWESYVLEKYQNCWVQDGLSMKI